MHLTFTTVVHRLETALAATLPGAAAHARLAPNPRHQWPDGFDRAGIRQAAVLLVVFPIGERAHIVLTVRGGALGRHSGQVSLPGGVVEAGETFEQTALREAHEEIALPIALVRVVGELTPLDIPVSGFHLHPVVAVMDRRPVWTPAHGEVDQILEVAVDDLLDRTCLVSNERDRGGHLVQIPAFHIADQEIWGATAMVLAEFLTLFGWPDDF